MVRSLIASESTLGLLKRYGITHLTRLLTQPSCVGAQQYIFLFEIFENVIVLHYFTIIIARDQQDSITEDLLNP